MAVEGAHRRYVVRHLAGLLHPRSRQDVAVLMVDVDHFKSINDRWGHRAGDRALGQIARLLEDKVREGDTLARYGGEEFVVVMPGARLNEAMEVTERLRHAVNTQLFTPDSTTMAPLSVSVGWAATGGRAMTVEQLLQDADHPLYAVKRAGRNRTVRAAEAA